VLSASVIVIVIGQQASDPSILALQRTLRGVLGADAHVQIEAAASDPPDSDSEAKAEHADGVVELVWENHANSAKIHCFVKRDARWVDREIGFGDAKASSEREALERGRLVGFAVATMFAPEAESTSTAEREPAPGAGQPPDHDSAAPSGTAQSSESRPPVSEPARTHAPTGTKTNGTESTETPATEAPGAPAASSSRTPRELEFAGIGSIGIGGSGGGLGAMAGVRFAAATPLWSRWFVGGRAGSIPQAQATTRTAFVGTGLALSSTDAGPWQLGLRLDAFACYLEATHLSEDDPDPVRRSRLLGGLDLAGELGWHFTAGTAVSVAAGIEALSGKTEVYLHQAEVSTIPALRTIGELGIKTSF
jgi:hypothetical protein